MLAWGLVPLIVRSKIYDTGYSQYDWYSNNADQQIDFFLIYKSYAIIIVAVLMTALLAYQIISAKRNNIKIEPAFYCLAAYAFLSLGSFAFSEYKYYVSHGTYELFEPIWVVLGYLIICYYTYYQVNTEKDVYHLVQWSSVGFAIMGAIGVGQFVKADLFRTTIGKKMIVPSSAWDTLDQLNFTFEPGVVYATLYNVDWVGFYTNIVFPVLIVMVFWAKKAWQKVMYGILATAMLICLFGARAMGGILGLAGAIAVAVLLLLFRSKKGVIVAGSLVIVGIVSTIVLLTNTSVGRSVIHEFVGSSGKGYEDFAIKGIETNDEDVVFHLADRELHINYLMYNEGSVSVECTDANGNEVETVLAGDDMATFMVTDPTYLNCEITPVYIEDHISLEIVIDGLTWHFTNQIDDTYYYYNPVGKFVKMPQIKDAAIFNNDAMHHRGVIWNHTIPLLGQFIIFGNGANTFAQVYPQNDYIYKAYMNMQNIYDVKAHNWYLQQWVEEGLIALLVFLAFYIIYLVQCIKLYRKVSFRDPLACMSVALFIGVTSYLITSIVCDSNVNTAPVFWVAFGLGYAVNRIIKEKISTN